MSKKPLEPQLYNRLVEAEKDLESGKISRREFNQLLALAATSAGVQLATMNPAFAWVATHMRKRTSTAASSFSTSNSLRFAASASAYLSRTPSGVGTSDKIYTLSFWVKRGTPASVYGFIYSTAAANDYVGYDNNSYTERLWVRLGGSAEMYFGGAQRDFAAWSHFVISVDTTKAVPAERVRVYQNGVQMTLTAGAYPSQNATTYVNQAQGQNIGRSLSAGAYHFDGLLCEFYSIDGQALTAGDFARADSTTGQWVPKQYSGSFGTNGFYLPFRSNSAASGSGTASGSYPNVSGVSGLGADYSGNNNHYTASGIATTDQLIDTPTKNFPCFSPIGNVVSGTSRTTLTQAALRVSGGASLTGAFSTQQFPSTGQWYAEMILTASPPYPSLGLALAESVNQQYIDAGIYLNSSTGIFYNTQSLTGPSTSTGVGLGSWVSGDVLNVALDMTNGKIWLGRNGTYYNSGNPAAGTNATFSGAGVSANSWQLGAGTYSGDVSVNFGQGGQSGLTYDSASGGSFKYTPPSGFKALSTGNLAAPAVVRPSQYFTAATYTGNGGGQRVGAVIPSTAGYSVARSLRFQSANSSNLSRTPAGATNRKTWTWSGWVKRSSATLQCLFTANASVNDALFLNINASGTITMNDLIVPTDYAYFTTSETFQDLSKWYHVVLSVDTTQATATDRWKLWVDGRQITAFSSSISFPQNYDTHVNSTQAHFMGYYTGGYPYYLDGYLTEVNFVDGLALTASSFGQTDATSGDWIPKQYTGSYGTNGFYLNFSDNSNTTAATLGKDSSGNGNNWTPNSFTTDESVIDTPTKNFCVLNPLDNGGHTLTAGNLKMAGPGAYKLTRGTIPITSGKWYWEAKFTLGTNGGTGIGIATAAAPLTNYLESSAYGWTYNQSNGNSGTNAAYYTYGAAYTTSGDVVGIAFDADAGTLVFYKNGSSQGTAFTGLTSGPYYPAATSYYAGNAFEFTFGQGGQSGLTYDSASGGSFKYTPPSGYKALCWPNLPAVSAGALQTTPDLVWIKGRSGATDHALYDSVRGVTLDLTTSSNAAETTQMTGLTSLTKTGFSTGSLAKLNTSGSTYVAWMWKKGATPGFDIVTYTGNGSAGRQISHSLGTVPAFYLTKCRDNTNNANGWVDWGAYHAKLPQTGPNGPQPLWLMNTNAVSAGAGGFQNIPTASVFSPNVLSYDNVNSVRYVAYLWAEVSGFSKMGSYTGNGSSDGPFIWCGFRPAFILLRNATSGAGPDWHILDTTRDNSNPGFGDLRPNVSGSESNGSGSRDVDFLSNGFKLRVSAADMNESGATMIFVAFAEAPFKYANAR